MGAQKVSFPDEHLRLGQAKPSQQQRAQFSVENKSIGMQMILQSQNAGSTARVVRHDAPRALRSVTWCGGSSQVLEDGGKIMPPILNHAPSDYPLWPSTTHRARKWADRCKNDGHDCDHVRLLHNQPPDMVDIFCTSFPGQLHNNCNCHSTV